MFTQQSPRSPIPLSTLSGECSREAIRLKQSVEKWAGDSNEDLRNLLSAEFSLETANAALGRLLERAGWKNGSCDNERTQAIFNLVTILRPDVFDVRLAEREKLLRERLHQSEEALSKKKR